MLYLILLFAKILRAGSARLRPRGMDLGGVSHPRALEERITYINQNIDLLSLFYHSKYFHIHPFAYLVTWKRYLQFIYRKTTKKMRKAICGHVKRIRHCTATLSLRGVNPPPSSNPGQYTPLVLLQYFMAPLSARRSLVQRHLWTIFWTIYEFFFERAIFIFNI